MLFIMKIFRNKIIRYAYLGWFVITLFFSYQYVLRVAPGVMIHDIRQSFHITAEQFATLGALYLLAYAALQIPLGILVDKIGVKKMCLYSIATLSGGALLLATTHIFWVAQVSRIIMGMGSASAFMCALKFIADHIPPGNRGFLMGATLTLGTGGAIIFGRVLKYFDELYYWHEIITVIAGSGLVIFTLIAVIVKGVKEDRNILLNEKSLSQNLRDIIDIMCSTRILIYAVLAVGLYTPLSALADLWGTAFIEQKFGLDKSEAAQSIMTLYIGLTVGSLLLPWLSEKYNILNKTIVICGFGLLVAFSILLYSPNLSYSGLIFTLFLTGFFGGAEMMCFTGALTNSRQHDSGQIIGVVNTLNMLGGALVQQLVGTFLDEQWDGNVNSFGLRQYSTHQFENSLSILTVLIGLCCIFSLFLFASKFKSNKY